MPVLNAFKIQQRGLPMYITTMKAGDLLASYKIDRWGEDNPKGYQRALVPLRVRKAMNYLLKEEGVFPTSILVNVRGKMEFRPKKSIDSFAEFGELALSPESLPFSIVDGQHRLEGLKEAREEDPKFDDYPVPVTIVNLPDVYTEMRQFYIINTRQKGVSTDLVQRHLYEMSEKMGKPTLLMLEGEKAVLTAEAIPVVDIIRNDPRSPWYNKVQLPSEKKQENHIIKQRPLTDSITYILKSRPSFRRKNPKELANDIANYWNALKEIFPEAFEDPKEFTIQRTPGAYSLHMIYSHVYDLCEQAGNCTQEKMKQILEKMFKNVAEAMPVDQLDSAFWHKKEGHPLVIATSMKTMKALAEYFNQALEAIQ
ncbi:MAG TPA: DGQHR domain-containing protein [Candidatus Bathyarchaeia archaeon]|nr:DGQHR domain-containing protein [Candidatus Bathyarchaeia archaeon]